ncbi:MAG: peptidoglycan DD-metalloendopeptidase family protein [Deltaproteobacteria bacterium]|nr:peptidoglycan DD-metalloendopeptidase family protein [Deltaproteobacteria bacterium]
MKEIKVQPSQYLPETNNRSQRDQDLKKACKDFESIFSYELLKTMRRTIEKSDLFHGGQGEEIYESLLDQELAQKMAGQGKNSIAELLYQQLRYKDLGDTGQIMGGDMEDNSLQWPLKAAVSSRFGWRKDPITGAAQFHHGIDLAAKQGTTVRAALTGNVAFSGHKEGYGNVVELDHGNGVTTLYAHNQKNLVTLGDTVKVGTPIARVGSTGRSTGPHLHFEFRKDGQAMDPLSVMGA